MTDEITPAQGSGAAVPARARYGIKPTRHCAFCTALVWRYRGWAYPTQEAAENARDAYHARETPGEWCLHCGSDTCEHAARHNASYGGAS